MLSKLRIKLSFFIMLVLLALLSPALPLWYLAVVVPAVLIHELAHAYKAQKLGYQVTVIELNWYGGGAQIKDFARVSLDDMIKIAFAGPLANMVLFAVSLVLYLCGLKIIWNFVLINAFMFLFNLLPLYPLDGYRILQAFLNKKRNFVDSIVLTARIGFIVTGTLILVSLFFVNIFFTIFALMFLVMMTFMVTMDVVNNKYENWEQFMLSSKEEGV